MAIYTADRYTKMPIEEVEDVATGLLYIKAYEIEDRHEGTYQENAYDLVDENHQSIL